MRELELRKKEVIFVELQKCFPIKEEGEDLIIMRSECHNFLFGALTRVLPIMSQISG